VTHRTTHPAPPALAKLALLALAVAGCAGSQPKQTGDENNFDQTPSGSGSASASAAAESAPKWNDKPSPGKAKASDDDLNEAQKEQMEIALRRGGDKVANCSNVVPGTPKGEGEVKVTFDGKKGRAIDVAVPAPWAGTDAEACIKRAFVGEIIVPFEGELEVPYTIHVGLKEAAKGDKDKDKDKDKGKGKGKDKGPKKK
jgi:hypothetical protein